MTDEAEGLTLRERVQGTWNHVSYKYRMWRYLRRTMGVRPPTKAERRELLEWIQANWGGDATRNDVMTRYGTWIAVFPHYCTGGPGYSGKVMVAIFDGSPSFYYVWTWRDGQLEEEDRGLASGEGCPSCQGWSDDGGPMVCPDCGREIE